MIGARVERDVVGLDVVDGDDERVGVLAQGHLAKLRADERALRRDVELLDAARLAMVLHHQLEERGDLGAQDLGGHPHPAELVREDHARGACVLELLLGLGALPARHDRDV